MPTYSLPQRPVFIDLETRSAADLPEVGGWNYAKDPTTRLLTVSWTPDVGQTYHVWLPGLSAPPPDEWVAPHVPGVVIHVGEDVPAELVATRTRPWVAHNAAGFDQLVWAECAADEAQPVEWLDSLHLSLSVGLPGKLDKIGQLLWGEGKYADGKALIKKWSHAAGPDDCEPENVPLAPLMVIARYNVQDVKLMADLWPTLLSEYKVEENERAVMIASDAINHRGVHIDRPLVTELIRLADESKKRSIGRIAELTDGHLATEKALNSRVKVLGWLQHMGVDIGKSLAKNIVAQYIDENADPDSDWDDDAYVPTDLARIVKVLELRMQALRVTGGKLAAALWSMSPGDRAYLLHAYHAAHTGRWAGRRIQTQNFPRPKDGVDPWAAVALFDRTGRLDYDTLAAQLPTKERDVNTGKLLYPYLSVEDVTSAMLRMMFIPDEDGEVIVAADLSQIEARVLAKLAGEKWLVDAFWAGADPYVKMAEAIAGPKEKWPEYKDPKTGKLVVPKKHPYRQQLGKIPELAAGYQMSGTKLALYAAAQGVNIEDFGFSADEIIWAYRRSHPMIAGVEAGEYNGRPYFRGGFWDQLNDAAVMAAERGGPIPVGQVEFHREGKHLICTLPSGRRLTYRNAKLVEKQFYSRTVPVVEYTHPRYGRKRLYGGLLAENVVQGDARDVIANAMPRLHAEGMKVNLHVHDEVVGSNKPERFDDFMRIVSTPPHWHPDFPLDAEGGMAPRYAKSPPPGCKDVTYRNGRPL